MNKTAFNAIISAVLLVGPAKNKIGDYVVFVIENLDNFKTYYYKTISSTKVAKSVMRFVHRPCVIKAKLKETNLCNTLTYVEVSKKKE